MALGGGTWVTQNKVLPGAYINVVSRRNSTIELGERGIVAVALPIGKSKGEVIEITVNQFVSDSSILGFAYTDVKAKALREIFAHATRAVIYDTGDGTGVTVANIVEALDPYEFNVLCAYTNTAADITYLQTIPMTRKPSQVTEPRRISPSRLLLMPSTRYWLPGPHWHRTHTPMRQER